MKRCEGRKGSVQQLALITLQYLCSTADEGKSKLLGKCAFQAMEVGMAWHELLWVERAPGKVSSEGLSGLTPLDDTADEACAQEQSWMSWHESAKLDYVVWQPPLPS